MENSFMPLSQKLIHALSWTLIHSLWQGMVLAVLTGLLLLTMRKARPALRYNGLAGLLFTFMLVSGGTFWLEYGQASGAVTLHAYTVFGGTDVTSSLSTSAENIRGADQERWLNQLLDFGTRHASVIVAVWFVVFLLKSVKAATGLYYIRRIRHHGIRPVPQAWKERVAHLARKLHISTRIVLMESELVQVPLVAGFLKPVILVPIGFLTNLPYSQVEAILLHELAHIRRKDYLVNLFQSLAENVFFFNPAVLWLSYLLREEREHCCDDLAIAITQNKSSFVEALVQFQEYKLSRSAPALAFAGRRNHLLDRIKRIIYNNNKQLDAMEKVFVAASLLTIAALSVAFSPTSQTEVPPPPPAPREAPAPPLPAPPPVLGEVPAPAPPPAPEAPPYPGSAFSADTISPKKKGTSVSTYHMTHNDKRYEIVEREGKITELKIDGVAIPEDKIEDYRAELEPVMAEAREHQKQAELHRAQAEVHRQQAAEHRKQAEVHRAQADGMRHEAEAMREQAAQHRKESGSLRASTAEARSHADEARREAEVHRQRAEVHRKEAEEHRRKAETKRAEFEKMQEELINDLMQAGTIQNKTNLSYKLSREELIVNGIKQPDALHQKLREKYLKETGVELFYNWEGKRGIMYSR